MEFGTLMKPLATKMKDLRTRKAWTQEDLAAKAGVSVPTVQRAERGDRVSADTVASLAEAFGLAAQDLAGEAPATDASDAVVVDYLPIREVVSGKTLIEMLAASNAIDLDYGEVRDEATADVLGAFYDFCTAHMGNDVPEHPAQRVRLELEAGRRLKTLRDKGLTVAGDIYTRTNYEVDDMPGEPPIVLATWDDICVAIRIGTDGIVVDRALLDPARLPKFSTVTESRVVRPKSTAVPDDEVPF